MNDTFTTCFKSNAPDPWNWNLYLFPLWCCGVVIRYGVLFPMRRVLTRPVAWSYQGPEVGTLCRLLLLLLGFALFFVGFFPVHFLFPQQLRVSCERLLIEFLASAFVISWTVCTFACFPGCQLSNQLNIHTAPGSYARESPHMSFFFVRQGVVRYHGPRPSFLTNQVFVANHTSMIDFIILEQVSSPTIEEVLCTH